MGVTFIGNPFDQEAEYEDSDWEMNAEIEWIVPPQEIGLLEDAGRATIGLIMVQGDESSGEDTDANWAISNDEEDESDEDYNPDEEAEGEDEDDNYDFGYVYNSDDEEEEDLDYVTFPLPDEQASDTDKPETEDIPNTGESSDTD